MESALKELPRSTFQAWVGHNRGRTLEAHQQEASSRGIHCGNIDIRHLVTYCHVARTEWCPDAGQFRNRSRSPYGGSLETLTMAFTPLQDTEEMADHVRETFQWHWRSALRPLRTLLEDYRELCPCFTLSEAEEAARDFNLPEMIQVTFYAMLLNDAVELGIASELMAADLKASLKGL
ncbi:hypothetical protein Cgig2_011076 [Carnegiea gigantea]|uniref:Uncharacterized protein n=1 Tax=Carnegiea gigantea TaxID=171969 RepID=A0A9Q1JSD5_9CARY|nr:hypothetical protein Cgig2_011076 [Carnegiea gigantea]